MPENNISLALFMQEEPLFISKILKFLIKRQSEFKYNISEIVLFKPVRFNKTRLDWFKERIILFRLREILFMCYIFLYILVFNFFDSKNSRFNFKNLASKNNIPISICNNINSPNFVEKIKSKELDLIISISCPQIFKTDILSSTKFGCINVHGTLLPKHRGIQGSWWTLFNDDKYAGTTIHYIEETIDSGDIIIQKRFKLSKNYSQFRLAYFTKRLSSYLILKAIHLVKEEKFKGIKMDKLKGNYNYNPSKNDIDEFFKRGKRVIRLSDMKYILSNNSSF